MPASEGLPLTQLVEERRQIMSRLGRLSDDRELCEAAAQRLESRLQSWRGSGIARASTRFKNKVAQGVDAICRVGADRAEILIVRALSITTGECQFTVSMNGVFASDSNGWTIDKTRIYVSGLSPLIDDAADILRQMRGPQGGRMFFDREDSFLNARNRHRFLTVDDEATPPTVLHGASRVAQTARSKTFPTCTTCFQILPATGQCDFC